MYTLYKFHFLNGISEINTLFDDILIIWPAPVYIYSFFFFEGYFTVVLSLCIFSNYINAVLMFSINYLKYKKKDKQINK